MPRYTNESDLQDLFADVSTIDVRRKKKIRVKIIDADGDEVDLKEMLGKLNEYITDNIVREDSNALKDEIAPLIAQIFMGAIIYATGDIQAAAFIASQERMRYSITHLMLLSFYFLKFVQKNELKIITTEEDVEPEEIERIRRVSKANSMATLAGAIGMNPKEILKELLANGQLTKEDLPEEFFEDKDDVSEQVQEKDTDGKRKNPTLTVTKVSDKHCPAILFEPNTSIKISLVTAGYRKFISMPMRGNIYAGTEGENRQILLAKIADIRNNDVTKYKTLKVKFVYRRDNKFDCNAIEALVDLPGSPRNNWSLGWVPKEYNKQLLDYYSNFDSEYITNINKISFNHNQFTIITHNGKHTLHCWFPLEYEYYDMFPRPNRLGLLIE